MASHSLEMTDGVTDGVHSHVAHVQTSGWVWKHGQDIKLLFGSLRKKNKRKKCEKMLERGGRLAQKKKEKVFSFFTSLLRLSLKTNLMRSKQN